MRCAAVLLLLMAGSAVGQQEMSAKDKADPQQFINGTVPTSKDVVDGVLPVSALLSSRMVLEYKAPEYPPIARAAHVTGKVVLKALIAQDGTVESLKVIEGPPMLQGAALEAVKHWRYQPYLVEDKPVEVSTTITLSFTLGKKAVPPKR